MSTRYLTLISNAARSLELYPNNTVAKFKTQLFNPVELDGNYEVALKEFICPVSFYNITGHEYYVEVSSIKKVNGNVQQETSIFSCPPGNYTNVQQVLDYINKIPATSNVFKLTLNEMYGRVEVLNTFIFRIEFSQKLRRMLGFGPQQPLSTGLAMNPVNMYINVPQQLFIYCDIVDTQLVGDGASKLLRNIGIEDVTKFGHLYIKTYDNPDYIPVIKNHFSTIEIDIRTSTDEPAPFEFGPSLVKVHFRKARV